MGNTEKDPLEESVSRCYATLRLVYSGKLGAAPARTLVLTGSSVQIGRTAGGGHALALSEDPRASEQHAELVLQQANGAEAPTVSITDLSSTNGTYVNGQRTSQAVLQDGDVVRIGSTHFVMRLEWPDVGDAALPLLRGGSPQIRRIRAEVSRLAASQDPVLLLGESGTGKEVVARSLHQASKRTGAFVAVNSAALPPELVESQLFGHLRGSFTGATGAHDGFFSAANNGSLLLDEIGDMPLPLQAKLLRALDRRGDPAESYEVLPVGGTQPRSVDVRIVAATNRDLEMLVKSGGFRKDLFARLRVHVIRLPRLSERREDILPLLLAELGPSAPPLSTRLAEALLTHDWPLHVRELKQVAAVLKSHCATARELDLPMLKDQLAQKQSQAHGELVRRPEKPTRSSPTPELLQRLLVEHGGVVARVAAAVGRSHRHVRRLLEQYNLNSKRAGQSSDE